MGNDTNHSRKLMQTHPDLEEGTLVYVLYSGSFPGPLQIREIGAFERYLDDSEDGDAMFVTEVMRLFPETVFNGSPVPALSVKGMALLPAEDADIYVGKEAIVRQLDSEGLEMYASIVDKL